ncbi:hypothetical protein C0052_05940 [Pseudomonas aeruginosa]|nr:hypothetical protein C0052_05940 [Pseudomonas aeruginosa]
MDGALAGPIRRSRFGGIEGRQAVRGGDSPQGFPLEASGARRCGPGGCSAALTPPPEPPRGRRRSDSAVGLEHRARPLPRPDFAFTAPRTERHGRGADRVIPSSR